LLHNEWLETNGCGGWSSSTVSGLNTRRYHGLLVDGSVFPGSRRVLISKFDEGVKLNEDTVELGTNQFPSTIHPWGFASISKFLSSPFPCTTFRLPWGTVEKEVSMIAGSTTVILRYLYQGTAPQVELTINPLFSGRDYHSLQHSNPDVLQNWRFEDDTFAVQSYPGVPQVFLHLPSATMRPEFNWHTNFGYIEECARGFDSCEDLFSYGTFTLVLKNGISAFIIATTNQELTSDAQGMLANERKRRTALVTNPPGRSAIGKLRARLETAANQFLVIRADRRPSVVAGYHWFTDWGRDTMIALPGLCIARGKLKLAAEILDTFATFQRDGLIPNRFADSTEECEYNSVDASLWFFWAVYHLWQAGGDRKMINERLLPAMHRTIDAFQAGTIFDIRVQENGLLTAGNQATQLTWMDARLDGQPITSRWGCAVEINALWYNALQIVALISGDRSKLSSTAALRQTFCNEFWNAQRNCLYDLIRTESDGTIIRDGSLRPNQIFAISLPFPLFEGPQAESILAAVQRELLTPYGLRSLGPSEHGYRGQYRGGPAQREPAYHQGTVWSWLLGPYLDALVAVRGAAGRSEVREILERFAPHLDEAGIGSISEIFDGDAPHAPRGCIAQAWSVGEVLRVCVGIE